MIGPNERRPFDLDLALKQTGRDLPELGWCKIFVAEANVMGVKIASYLFKVRKNFEKG